MRIKSLVHEARGQCSKRRTGCNSCWPRRAGVLGSMPSMSLGNIVAMLAALVVLAPVAEEAIFRAGLHEQLLRWGLMRGHANALTVLAFVLVHGLARSWALGLAVALPAWWIGRVYGARRRLRPCIAWHAGFNLVWVALALAAPHSIDFPTLLG